MPQATGLKIQASQFNYTGVKIIPTPKQSGGERLCHSQEDQFFLPIEAEADWLRLIPIKRSIFIQSINLNGKRIPKHPCRNRMSDHVCEHL